MTDSVPHVTTLMGPVERIDGQFCLRIPIDIAGPRLIESLREAARIDDTHVTVVIPDEVAVDLRLTEGSIVSVDNYRGDFTIRPVDARAQTTATTREWRSAPGLAPIASSADDETFVGRAAITFRASPSDDDRLSNATSADHELRPDERRAVDAMVRDLDDQMTRVGVDLRTAMQHLNERFPPERSETTGDDTHEYFTESFTIDVTGIVETLRGLPDGAGTSAFVTAYNAAYPDWRDERGPR